MPSQAERVVFGNTFDGLFNKALREKLSTRGVDQLKGLGVELRKLGAAYPVDVWIQALQVASADIYPRLPRDQAHYALGQDAVRGVVETTIGRAMAALARVVGVKRTLARMNHNLRNSDNFVQTTVADRGESEVEFSFNECLNMPRFYEGILRAAAEIAGGKDVKVDPLKRNGPEVVFRVRWS